MSTIESMLKSKFFYFFKTQIFAIFFCALIIRFFFLFIDYPFVLHPDEPTVVNSTINLRFNLNPGHFDWPTFYYYVNYPFYFIFEKIFFKLSRDGFIPYQVIDPYYYYILSRIITTFFGALTVIFVYRILKNLEVSKEVSLLGSCILALIPFHVSRSAQALIDVPMVFLSSVSLYFLSCNLKSFKNKNYYLACFFAGLSVSTKYNGYMIFLIIGLYLIYIKRLSIRDWFLYLSSVFFSALGFFIGTPYALLDYKTFLISYSPKGAVWQFTNVGKVSINQQFVNFFHNLFLDNNLLMGYLPLFASILFIGVFIYKRQFLLKDNISKFVTLLIIQFIFIFWSVSGVKVQRSQYLILAYLFLPVFSALLFENFVKEKFKIIISYLFFVMVSIYTLYIRIGDVALIEFYKNVRFTSNKESYLILQNDKYIEMILKELKIPTKKYIKNYIYSGNITHFVSNSEICSQLPEPCNYKLIDKIESRSDPEKVYIYETN